MESLQQLSNESFSYRWTINLKPSFDPLESAMASRSHSFDTQDCGSFIEMDPNKFTSRRQPSHDFYFNTSSSQSPLLIHADDIFSDGLLLPLHLANILPERESISDSSDSALSRSLSIDSSKRFISESNQYRMQQCLYPHTAPATPSAMSSTSTINPSRNPKLQKLPFLRSPKKILSKYLFFLTPLYKKVKGLRLSNSSKSTSSSEYSPRTSNAYSSIDWCHVSATENKIYDAVLHCKRSIVSERLDYSEV